MAKGPEAFRTISEASGELGVAQHVLRFWETRFSFVRPMKRTGGRRFYRPRDIVVLATIKRLLYEDGLSIKEVQALHRGKGFGAASAEARSAAPPSTPDGRILRLQSALEALESAQKRLNGLLANR